MQRAVVVLWEQPLRVAAAAAVRRVVAIRLDRRIVLSVAILSVMVLRLCLPASICLNFAWPYPFFFDPTNHFLVAFDKLLFICRNVFLLRNLLPQLTHAPQNGFPVVAVLDPCGQPVPQALVAPTVLVPDVLTQCSLHKIFQEGQVLQKAERNHVSVALKGARKATPAAGEENAWIGGTLKACCHEPSFSCSEAVQALPGALGAGVPEKTNTIQFLLRQASGFIRIFRVAAAQGHG